MLIFDFKKAKIYQIPFLSFAVLFFLFSCKPHLLEPETVPELSGLETLLIFPFKDMAAVYGQNVDVRCPLCGNMFMTGEVSVDAEDVMTDYLTSLMQERTDFKILTPEQAKGIISGLPPENKKGPSEVEIIVAAGRAFDADVVMVSHIYRFTERIGTSYAVDSPASVAFDIHLVRVSDGRILWVGSFDETQRPLTENLFKIGAFFKRKWRWITAGEMAASALDDVLTIFLKQ